MTTCKSPIPCREDYPLLTANQFLEFSFGDRKAELDHGIIRVLDGVTSRHASVQGNLLTAVRQLLRGTDCRVYNSQLPIRTSLKSVRVADVAVYLDRAGRENDDLAAFDDPCVLFEVMSAGPLRTNLHVKLEEYRALPSVDSVVLVDASAERVRIVQREAPNGWSDVRYERPHDVALPALGITVPHTEIFARD